MISNSESHLDLFGMLDKSLMDDGQKHMSDFLKRAENDPILQQRLANFLERELGILTSNSESGIHVWKKNYDKPEGIIKFCRQALALGTLKNIPGEKLN